MIKGKVKIIGIAGSNGSGKDTIGGLLAREHNFLFVSLTDFLREELKKRQLPNTRDQTRTLSAEWRRQYGLDILVRRAFKLYKDQEHLYSGLAMASLRNEGEADAIHALNGLIIWVDAEPKIRYQRIQENFRGEDRAINDRKTFQDFINEEQAEMKLPKNGDATMLSMSAVKAKSDLFLINDGKDLNELGVKLNRLLNLN